MRRYRGPRIAVVVGDNVDGVGGTYRRGLCTVTTATAFDLSP